mmetsp:Transcript_3343/g.7370  ORF Transcript_3343/g.7370 Transcript_3343/m.7370 type:complete len:321 (-) Transcript_3343:4858-5820(-)
MAVKSYPPLLQNSHEEGSNAAILRLMLAIASWELLYHVSRFLLKICLKNYHEWILDESLLKKDYLTNNSNGDSSKNGDNEGKSPQEESKHTLLQRGPSYMVSLIHSVYATWRGILHLYNLHNVSNFDKLMIPATHAIAEGVHTTCRWAHLEVATTNTLFLAYLLYDLVHIVAQFPKLGGVDTIIHHLLFASCSLINGTFGIMAFPFGWLVVGEASTIFLNLRWFLLKTGRNNGLLAWINALFAGAFFLTRNIVYTAGMVHLFFFSRMELQSLEDASGVPKSLLWMTCGCIVLGWALNCVWGSKILVMMTRKKNDGAKKEK